MTSLAYQSTGLALPVHLRWGEEEEEEMLGTISELSSCPMKWMSFTVAMQNTNLEQAESH